MLDTDNTPAFLVCVLKCNTFELSSFLLHSAPEIKLYLKVCYLRIFAKMNYSGLLLVVFIITAIKHEDTEALDVVNMDTAISPVQVKTPWWGSQSSGILKSSNLFSYSTNTIKNLTLSAPVGYGILAAIRMIDLRPYNVDKLTLFIAGSFPRTVPVTYTNPYSFRRKSYDSQESLKTFDASNGQLGISFVTGPGNSFGYDGFQLTYTAYSTDYSCGFHEFKCSNGKCIADILTCDGHNHCGDRSDQSSRACKYPGSLSTSPNVAGIVCGVIFLGIAVGCAVFIIVRRARRNNQTVSTTVVSHPPPPTYLPPTQPGTVYPPPPPQYSQYPQGHTNPTYR